MEPGKQDLRDIEDNIKCGNGDQTAADLGVFMNYIMSDRALVHPIALQSMRENILPWAFISIKNAATAIFPVGMAKLKKKTVIQVKKR